VAALAERDQVIAVLRAEIEMLKRQDCTSSSLHSEAGPRAMQLFAALMASIVPVKELRNSR